MIDVSSFRPPVSERSRSHRASAFASAFAMLALAAPCSGQEATPQPSPAPTPPSVTAEVVVTADAEPLEERSLGVTVTVIDREEIDRRQATSLLELLRTVPGLNLVQSGGPGGVTSMFLRGTNSTQVLMLVDGVKLNSPFFGGVDLSSFATASVERVEVVSGPFSALYGSEAVGGVIQVFTRAASRATGFSGRGTLGAGNASARQGTLSAGYAQERVQASFGFRREMSEGELANDAFSVTNVLGSLDFAITPDVHAGVVVRDDHSRTLQPLNNAGAPSPRRSTTVDTTTVALPFSAALGNGGTLGLSLTYMDDRPGYEDPDDPFAYTFSETTAKRAGGRVVYTQPFGAHTVSLGADYDRTEVRYEDPYGVQLDDQSLRTWAGFVEDRIKMLEGRLVATLGVRYDDHSAFGGSTNPLASIAWRPVETLKLRAAGGTAFRSPTTGELYYPGSGNPDLKAEESTGFEIGADWDAAPGLLISTTLFTRTISDLIQYDFTTFTNKNVGRARARGVDLVVRAALQGGLFTRAGYTYTDAEDRDTGDRLLRRPQHAAFATLGMLLAHSISFEVTGTFVGERADVDVITFATVESPSYFRLDLAATGPRFFEHLSPFVRVSNLLDRDYQEVSGYVSPGIRFVAGVDVGF